MFLSKIWFILVGLLAGVALTAAFVAPRPADRRIEQLEGQRLDRAQYAAEQMLKTDAHRWIDYVAKLGRDAVIAESLDAATKGSGEPRMIHETVRARLHALVPDLAGIGVETLIAVDDRGRVVARVGDRENEYGDLIGGAEVVNDALRGYQSDDVWGNGGKLRRIAAAPVLAKTRDRIVGTVLVGAETGKRLAEVWKKNLGVDIVLLLRKQILSATLPEALLSQLPDLVEGRKTEIEQAKRTRAMSVPQGTAGSGGAAGGERLLAVAAPFSGQAGQQDAYYVLIGKMAPASDPWALLSSTVADDLKWENFPWLGLGCGLIAILGIGLFLQHYETEAPLLRLRKELKRVASGDLLKVNDTHFRAKFGGLARDANAALERFTHATDRGAQGARKELNALLDSGSPDSSGRVFDFSGGNLFSPGPGQPSPSGAPPPPPGGGPSPFGGPPSPGVFGSAPSAFAPPPPFGGPAPPAPFASAPPPAFAPPPQSAPFAAPPPPAPFVPGSPAYASFDRPASAPSSAPLSLPPLNLNSTLFGVGPQAQVPPALRSVSAPPAAPAARTPSAPVASEAPSLASTPPPTPVARRPFPVTLVPEAQTFVDSPTRAEHSRFGDDEHAPPRSFGADTNESDASPDRQSDDEKTGTISMDAEEAHIREVFAEYVAARRQCGEPVGSITLEKFRAKLAANRQQLIAKYACRTARFSVYIKDGKAAIKATPVRD
jgi:hypothetical protein